MDMIAEREEGAREENNAARADPSISLKGDADTEFRDGR